MEALKIKSPEHLLNVDKNPYNTSAGIITENQEFYTADYILNNWEEFEGQTLIYFIHWEGEDIATENGEMIYPAYED